MKVDIRRFQEGDLPSILRLMRRVLAEYGLWRAHANGLDDLRDVRRIYIARGGEFLVVTQAKRLVGCGGLLLMRDGRIAIQRMYLEKSLRGQGIGRRVLRRLEAKARRAGHTRLVLETSPRLKAAIGLYLSEGFRKRVLDIDNCCNVRMAKRLA